MLIQTERLILRKLREEDFEDFCEYAMDDEMSIMMGRKILATKEDARWNFEWLKDKEDRCYGLVYKENNKVIGNITLTNPPKDILKLEEVKGKVGRSMSFSISKDYQRRGLMFEALEGLIDYLFSVEGLDYIQCGYFPFNLASQKLQEKLGFSYLTTIKYDDGKARLSSIENILWNNR